MGKSIKVGEYGPPNCDERYKLSNEKSDAWGEFYEYREILKATPKNDPHYPENLNKLKKAKGKVRDRDQKLTAHIREHNCG